MIDGKYKAISSCVNGAEGGAISKITAYDVFSEEQSIQGKRNFDMERFFEVVGNPSGALVCNYDPSHIYSETNEPPIKQISLVYEYDNYVIVYVFYDEKYYSGLFRKNEEDKWYKLEERKEGLTKIIFSKSLYMTKEVFNDSFKMSMYDTSEEYSLLKSYGSMAE